MKLLEIFNTSLPLKWTKQSSDYFTSFVLDDKKYGISVNTEILKNISCARVDFHYVDKDDHIHHEKMDHGAPTGKVFGVVANGIKYKFSDFDCLYFIAKKATLGKADPENEYASRTRLYRYLMTKLAVEMNRVTYHHSGRDEEVFILCKSRPMLDVIVKELI